ncbi:UNVERIFIED_CONTAM: hypothetical protein K2H54_055888 [Gekko kuhli]
MPTGLGVDDSATSARSFGVSVGVGVSTYVSTPGHRPSAPQRLPLGTRLHSQHSSGAPALMAPSLLMVSPPRRLSSTRRPSAVAFCCHYRRRRQVSGCPPDN